MWLVSENAVKDEQLGRRRAEEQVRQLTEALQTLKDEKHRALQGEVAAKEAAQKAEDGQRRAVAEAHKAREQIASTEKQVALVRGAQV